MTPARFPTYAAEERLHALRAAGVQPVPLHGTPSPALPQPLLEALADELARTTGREVDPFSELVVTNGAMQALGVVFRSLLSAGDDVVIPAPCFFFEGPIRAAGARPVYVPSSAAAGWRWDADAIERAIGPSARVLLLCNPENPTGHVPSAAEVAAAVAVAEHHGLLVVTDEAYERSLWEGATLASAFGIAGLAVVVRSLGKSLAMPHLRLGLLAGPADLVVQCAHTLEWDCLRVGIASQAAALAALSGPRDWLDRVAQGMAGAREAALDVVSGIEGLDVVRPRGGPFLFLDAVDGRVELADELLAVGLPVVDGTHFQARGRARLPFGGAAEARPALERALALWASSRGPEQPVRRAPDLP